MINLLNSNNNYIKLENDIIDTLYGCRFIRKSTLHCSILHLWIKLLDRKSTMTDTKTKILNITRLFNHGPSPFRTCQWPHGEPGTKGFHFCGDSTLEGYSYCSKHVEMAYREPEPRRKVA